MFLKNGGRDDRRGRGESVNIGTCIEVVTRKMAPHTKESDVTPSKRADFMLINVLNIQEII